MTVFGYSCPDSDCDGELRRQDHVNIECADCGQIYEHHVHPTDGHQLLTVEGDLLVTWDWNPHPDAGGGSDA